MSELENNLIEKVKILILYGDRPVDGENKDGKVERIFRDEDDTAHYFYIREFLQSHMKDEEELQNALKERSDVNSVFYEMQKLGHIVFAENTSSPDYKTGIFYMPKEISKKQKQALKVLKGQLEKYCRKYENERLVLDEIVSIYKPYWICKYNGKKIFLDA